MAETHRISCDYCNLEVAMVKTASSTPYGYTYIWDKPKEWVRYKDRDYCHQDHLAKDILNIPLDEADIDVDELLKGVFDNGNS